MRPFIVEKRFVFKGISGEHIERGRIRRHTYIVLAYDRNRGEFLTEKELSQTLLYRNYLSNNDVREVLKRASMHLRRKWWHVERMRKEALARYKVVWRDIANEFVPAVDVEGVIPDHNVHYITTNSPGEAYYLLAILLAPQINAVVRELSPWVGHVQPRLIRYFKIPRYDPSNTIHKQLEEKGRAIHERGMVTSGDLKNIETLIEQLAGY